MCGERGEGEREGRERERGGGGGGGGLRDGAFVWQLRGKRRYCCFVRRSPSVSSVTTVMTVNIYTSILYMGKCATVILAAEMRFLTSFLMKAQKCITLGVIVQY